MIKSVLAATLAVVLAGGASAVTVSSVNGPDAVPAGQHVLFDFDSVSTAGTMTGTGSIVNGSSPGVYAAPYLDKTSYLTVGANQTETLHLNTAAKTLSLYWGSIDAYNQIAFFRTDGTLIQGYYGNAIPMAPANGSQGDPLNNRRVLFDFGPDRAAYVTFNSSANAFELDTVAGSVPEPMTWGMLVAGFALVGGAARLRRPTSVAA